MTPVLRGIFLTSDNPEATARFYRDVVGLPLEPMGDPDSYVYWKSDKDGMQLAIHDAKLFSDYSYPSRFDSNVTHLYFKIDDLPSFLAGLDRFGVVVRSIDDVVATVADPDGRMVMFGTA